MGALPFLVLRHGVERELLLSLPDFNDGCDEFDQESGNFEKRRVEVVEEIDDETFDMRSIMILQRECCQLPFHK